MQRNNNNKEDAYIEHTFIAFSSMSQSLRANTAWPAEASSSAG